MKEWNKWHNMGDAVVADKLSRLNPNNKELKQLKYDCWEHSDFKKGGTPYHIFKDNFIAITSKYVIDWDFDKIEE